MKIFHLGMIFEAVLVVAFGLSWMVTIAVNSNQCVGLPMFSIGLLAFQEVWEIPCVLMPG